MNSDLLLHPKTAHQYTQLLAGQSHAILVAGPTGSGKETTARHLASAFLGVTPEALKSHAYVKEISPDGDSISIEEIRTLQNFLKLRVPGEEQAIKRVVIIKSADRMRAEAQNALLKTLEEPPLDTSIILTAPSTDALLPTISSRTAVLNILPVSLEQATGFFKAAGKKSVDISRFYALSQGQAGLLSALLNEEGHPLIDQVDIAKELLALKPGERLLRSDELSKDKEKVRMLLNALSRIAHAALLHASKQGKQEAVKQWHKRQEAVIAAINANLRNPNQKLLLDDLFLNI